MRLLTVRMVMSIGVWSAASLVSAPGAETPELTGVTVQGGSVRLVWGAGLDRYIVERFVPGHEEPVAVGTSSSVVDYAATVAIPSDSRAFFRLRSGLQAVRLTDAALEAAVRSNVGSAKTGPTNWLYDADVAGLTNLAVALRGVSQLDGVAGLQDLLWFDAGGNQIASLAALAACQDLQVLRLDGNQLGSLAGLEALLALQVLDVSHNVLSDLQPLGALNALEVLYADGNQIGSIAVLANLHALRILDLSNNSISDISPLLQNAAQGGLGNGDTVYLGGNPLAIEADVAALRGYGVTVVFP